MLSRSKLKSVDFYRKIPKDMTEGTVPGSVISLLASFVIALLLVSEVTNYLTPQFNTRVVVDRSLDGDLMRINFNVSFPRLSCEFASVDVGDVMGMNKVRKAFPKSRRPAFPHKTKTDTFLWIVPVQLNQNGVQATY